MAFLQSDPGAYHPYKQRGWARRGNQSFFGKGEVGLTAKSEEPTAIALVAERNRYLLTRASTSIRTPVEIPS
jgi:hypothetical protein